MTAPKGIDREEIWQKHQQGVPSTRIAVDLGIARNTVVYHLRNLRKEKGGAQTSNLPKIANSEESTTTDNGENSVADSSMTN